MTVPPSTANCAHRWRIEPAIEAESRGVCRLCGAERTFLNALPGRATLNNRRDITIGTESVATGDLPPTA